MVQRERYETYQKSIFMGRIMAMSFGVAPSQLARAEEMLELAIFHTAYDPRQIQAQMEQAHARILEERNMRLRDARLLQSVARLSEDDRSQDSETFKTSFKKDTKIEANIKAMTTGITQPWRGK
jgi:hypothetical protein